MQNTIIKNSKFLFLLLLLLLFSGCNTIQKTGQLRMIGNVPFTQLVLTENETDYVLEGDSTVLAILQNQYQGERILIKGRRKKSIVNGQEVLVLVIKKWQVEKQSNHTK